jgi:hypothetical protein
MDAARILVIVLVLLVCLGAAASSLRTRRARRVPAHASTPNAEAVGPEDDPPPRSVPSGASRLDIRPLMRDEVVRFTQAWELVQAHFIAEPKGAVTQADRLLGEILYARAFPIGEIEAYAADISMEYPRLVKNYRVSRGIALRIPRGQTSTEDLRQAFLAYRALFDDLLSVRPPSRTRQRPMA